MKASSEFLEQYKPDFEWKVPSKKDKGVTWTVSWVRGKYSCDCPATKVCSHIKIVKYYNGDTQI